jgi:maleylpyruvate isomerase
MRFEVFSAGEGRYRPDVVLDSLLADIVAMWQRKDLGGGLVIVVDGCDPVAVHEKSAAATKVAGPLPAVVRWAAGRGAVGLGAGGENPEPPHWL